MKNGLFNMYILLFFHFFILLLAGALDYATKGSIPEMYEPHEFLIELNLKDDCYITSASLSENAQWIATCDVENIRLFKLIRSKVSKSKI